MVTQAQANEAREILSGFVSDSTKILVEAIQPPNNLENFVMEEMRQPLVNAWREFLGDGHTARILEAVAGLDSQKLEAHGLYGAQLDAKIALFNKRRQLFQRSQKRRLLWWLLDAIDTLLDSIIAVTGIGGPLKELKDVLRNAIAD